MFEINESLSCRIREKRAKYRIGMQQAADQIGITRQTLWKIESERSASVNRTVYKKLVDWLVNEKIYEE